MRCEVLSENNMRFILVAQGVVTFKTRAIAITQDMNYVYVADNWYGLFIGDLRTLYSQVDSQLATLQNNQSFQIITLNLQFFWFSSEVNPTIYVLILLDSMSQSSNSVDQFIILGVRSTGIFIFDISNKLNPVLFQQIPCTGRPYALELSSDQNLIYYSNGFSIFTYQRGNSNFNNNSPNLFNQHQEQNFVFSSAFNKWRCYIQSIDNANYYFGAYETEGVYISSMRQVDSGYQLDKLEFLQLQNTTVQSLQFYSNSSNTLMYAPLQGANEIIRIYDITTPNSIVYLNSLKTKNGQRSSTSECIQFSSDYNYLLLTQDDGILLINSSDKQNLQIIYNWVGPLLMIGEYSSVVMTSDNKWIIGTVRGYGVYVIDATNKSQLNLKSIQQTLGGESIILSISSNLYAYLADGFQGIAILDLSVLPNISIISRVRLNGWSNFLTIIPSFYNGTFTDQYLFVATLEDGMISVVDISDIDTPVMFNSMQISNKEAQSLCLLNSQNQQNINNNVITYPFYNMIFIQNPQSVYEVPLVSTILIHSELMIETLNSSGQTQYTPSGNNSIYIGQSILLILIPIYPIVDMQVTTVYYWNTDYVSPQQLPTWIQFNTYSDQLTLSVSKEALGYNHVEGFVITLILQIELPLQQSNFQYASSKYLSSSDDITTSDEAGWIYNYLMEEGYIYSNGQISSKFTLNTRFNFTLPTRQAFSQVLCDRVQTTFMSSIFFNPIYLQAYSSLSFSINSTASSSSTNSTTNQYLQTQSTSNINLSITISDQIGKFVNLQYNGVVASYNTNQTEIVLSGTLDNINLILNNRLLYYSNLTSNEIANEALIVSVYIDDSTNYPQSLNFSFQACSNSFLNVQGTVKTANEPTNTLQQQFNKQNGGSIMNIESTISMTFTSSAFKNPDGFPTLTYTSEYSINGGQFQSFGQNFWLQPSTNQLLLSFSGTSPLSSYNDLICINATATNQYSSISDTFCMDITGIPFSYVLNILITLLGPIIGAVGFWSKKGMIFNIFFRSKVTYSEQVAQCGQVYEKKIPILSLDVEKAIQLLLNLIERYQNDYALSNNLPQCLKVEDKFDLQNSQKLDREEQLYDEEQEEIKQKNEQSNKQVPIHQSIRRLKPLFGVYYDGTFNSLQPLRNINIFEENSNTDKNNNNKNTMNKEQKIELKKDTQSNLQSQIPTFQQIETEGDYQNNPQKHNAFSVRKNEKTQYEKTDTTTSQQQQNGSQQKQKKNSKNEKQILRANLLEMKGRIIQFLFQFPIQRNKLLTLLSYEYMRKNGQIKMSSIVNDILNKQLKISIMAQEISSDQLKQELTNRQSCLYICLKCIAARHFLSLDPRSLAVYNYIKNYCKATFDQGQYDWYLSIINIEANVNEKDKYGNFTPFPKVSLKEEVLNKILIEIQLHNQLNQRFHSISSCEVNPYLIEQALFADAYGIQEDYPSFLFSSLGESIHLERQDILQIQAFKRIESSYIMKIREWLNLDYLPYSISKNNSLPNWLNVIISSNCLILQGTPSQKDLFDDVLIRIIHVDEYIIKQFKLKILDEYNPYLPQNEQPEEDSKIQNSSFNNQSYVPTKQKVYSKSQKQQRSQRNLNSSQNYYGSRDQSQLGLNKDNSMIGTSSREFKDQSVFSISQSQIDQDNNSPIKQPTFTILSTNLKNEGESPLQLKKKSLYFQTQKKTIDQPENSIFDQQLDQNTENK